MRTSSALLKAAAPSSIGVLGGGLTGLTSAFYLSRLLPRSSRIVLYEKEDRLGGWMQSNKQRLDSVQDGGMPDSCIFEAGPRTVRPVGLAGMMTLDLVRELGLSSSLITVPKSHPAAKNRFIYYPDRLNQLPSSLTGALSSLYLPALRSAPLAVLRDLLRPAARRTPEEWASGDESVDSFFTRRFGKRVARNLVSAMIHGIYAGDSRQLSVRALFPSLWEMERQRGGVLRSLIRGGVGKSALEAAEQTEAARIKATLPQEVVEASVWGLNGGLETLTRELATYLRRQDNVAIKMKANVDAITAADGKLTVRAPELTDEHTHLISAISSMRLAAKTPTLKLPHLTANPSVTVAVVNLAFHSDAPSKRMLPVQGFGYLIPRSVSRQHNPHHALGVIFDSDIMPSLDSENAGDIPDGLTKLTVMLGGHYWAHPREVPHTNDLAKAARQVLRDHLGITEEPVAVRVNLQRSCIPQYRPGHVSRMKELHSDLEDRLGGRLAVVGSSYNGVGVNDCVKNARQTVERLIERGGATGLENIASAA